MKTPEYRLFRIFSVLLISCCLLLCFGLPAAVAEEASGACGEQLDWTLDQDGTLTVSGSGPMMDFTGPSGTPWAGRKSSIARVILEPGVTTVGSYAFYACTGISEAVLPDTLVSVGDYAFTMCASLSGITFPAGMEAIGQSAFYNCRKLTSLDIPGSISEISAEAFRKTGVTDLVIREGVTKIDSYAFFGTPVVRVFLPASVRTVSPGAFADCGSLATVIYSGTAEEAAGIQIGTENTCLSAAEWVDRNGDPLLAGPSGGTCGADLSWTLSADGTLTISGSGEMDHYSAASGAPWESRKGQITKIVVESGVTALGSRAFHGCGKLEEVVLPEGLLSLGNYTFYLCTSLSSIVLPDTVTKIGDSCFEQCGALTAVRLPASLQTIGWYAFSSCAELTGIAFPASLKEIGQSAFSICPKLTTVVIPGSVASVSTEAFEYSGLETLILLDGVREIEGYAFSGTPLRCIQLPASVKVISASAFTQCENLKTVRYTGTREEADGVVIGSGNSCLDAAAWQYLSVPQDPSQTFTLPSDLRVIGPEAFDGTAAEAVVIPASVQEIASGAFDHCSALRLLVFEGSPAQIAADALGGRTDVIISVSPGSTAEAWAKGQNCTILYH